MGKKVISVRLDAGAQRALSFLTRDGVTQDEAIGSALLSASREAWRAQVEADAKRLANDPRDRALVAELHEFFGELDTPP